MPDRAALVTGASSGIGFAIARMLGEAGTSPYPVVPEIPFQRPGEAL